MYLEIIEEAARNCMKCGFCRASCPLFDGVETNSPRAKVRMSRAVVRGEMDPGDWYWGAMSLCLNCKTCRAECPAGVEVDRVVLAARAEMVKRRGLGPIKSAIFHRLLPNPSLIARLSSAASVAGRLSAINRPGNPLRLALPGIPREMRVPLPARRPFLASTPEFLPSLTGKSIAKAIYFVGCAQNYIYTDAARSTVSVLRKSGVDVLIPREQVCCGTPAFNSGDIEGARALAERDLQILAGADVDFIVTSCGSCGLTLREEWSRTLGLEVPETLSSKVVDITELLVERLGVSLPWSRDARPFGRVTYHDSCHLNRGMGVSAQPRKLLSAAPGVEFVEMADAARCCGGGGAFCLYHPDDSQRVAEVKMAAVAASGAQAVVTGCPSCLMQLEDSLFRRRMPQMALHVSQVVDAALSSEC
ncbi:MAG: (Fe-S)-binding protein [Armatimonadota bacterium]|nr:(Fe-S)-binding protein [Armatimonadota bacterium]